MLDLQPGETFRHLVTFYQQGRDSPRVDLTGVEINCVNLSDAPWDIEPIPIDLPNGQVQLYIPDTTTRLADEYTTYPFQVRLKYPTDDVQYVGPINICTGTEFIDDSITPPPNQVTLQDLGITLDPVVPTLTLQDLTITIDGQVTLADLTITLDGTRVLQDLTITLD